MKLKFRLLNDFCEKPIGYFMIDIDNMNVVDRGNVFQNDVSYLSYELTSRNILLIYQLDNPSNAGLIVSKKGTLIKNGKIDIDESKLLYAEKKTLQIISQSNPNSYNQTVDFSQLMQSYLISNIIIQVAGGSGGNTNGWGVGGTGGITTLEIPISDFINKFGQQVTFYYVVGGQGQNGDQCGGGGGASMVAVGNWPHNGGTTLVIAGGGGGGSSGCGGVNGGGGGGGNNPGQSVLGCNTPGQGGANGQGGSSGSVQGGPANPNLIDICGGGGGGWGATSGSGSGGGTGGPGQSGSGNESNSGTGGYGYQGGGNGASGNAGMGSNDNYSGGIASTNGGPSGGYGGGGAGSTGGDAGGGGGYGGGGGSWWSGAGGGGGYCITSIGSFTYSDYTNNGGNVGNGYVTISIEYYD